MGGPGRNIIISETYSDELGKVASAMNADVFSMIISQRFSSIRTEIDNENPFFGIRSVISSPNNFKINGKKVDNLDQYFFDPVYFIDEYIKSRGNEFSNDSKIFINFDLDAQGQLMSSILYYLLSDGVFDRSRIFRTILMSISFVGDDEFVDIGFGEFYTVPQLSNILELKRKEMEIMNVNPVTRIGFRKMCSIYEIEYFRHVGIKNSIVKNKNPNGTSLVTYMTKESLQET